MSSRNQGESAGEQARDRSPPPPQARSYRSHDMVHALEGRLSPVELAMADSKDRLNWVEQDFEQMSGDMVELDTRLREL